MPRFVNDTEHTTIQAEWWGGDEVCVIRRFNYGDRQYLAGQTVQVGIRPGEDEDDTIADVAIERMNLAILERGIVSWTGPDGQGLPVTAELIEALDERDAEFILEEINALNPWRRRTAEEQATFRGAGGGGGPAE